LFNWLSSTLVAESDSLNLTQFNYRADADGELIETSDRPWIVTGWTENDDTDQHLVCISEDGLITESQDSAEFLIQWASEFMENRTHSNS
jgi:hypothetical protein